MAAISLLVGLAIRAHFLSGADFPLNDGGLFLVFIEEILGGGFEFPHFIEWNGNQIPFAYPPLSFYGVAALAWLTGIEPVVLVEYVPVCFNLASIPLFVWIAARILPSSSSLFFASIAFPLIPRSYEWLIMGGGVSRSPAMFAMLVALILTMESIDRRRASFLVAATGTLGLVLMLHLEWAISAWVVVTLVLLASGPIRSAIGKSVAVGLGMGLVSLPWWGSVVAIHGIDPYVAAMTTGGWEADTFASRITHFDVFTFPGSWLAIVAAFGLVLAWSSGNARQILIVAWLLAIYATTPRHAKSVAALPVAMLLGIALARATEFLSGMMRLAAERSSPAPSTPPHRQLVGLLHLVVAVSASGYMFWEVEHPRPNEPSPLVALTPAERSGMAWIAENVDPAARFLVASPSLGWAWDRAAEWFPLLAAHHSVSTLQGLEWVVGVDFDQELKRSDTHRQAAFVSPSIAPQLGLQIFGPAHDHVAVFAPKGAPIRLSYAQSEIYESIHEDEAIAVYRMRPEIFRSLAPQSNAALVR